MSFVCATQDSFRQRTTRLDKISSEDLTLANLSDVITCSCSSFLPTTSIFLFFYGSKYSPKLYPQKKMMQTCLLE